MKKKLMMILMMLGVQASVQATWMQDLHFYYIIARHVVVQKIKSFNFFGKAVGSSDDDDDIFSFESEAPAKNPTFKLYSRNKKGQVILPQIKRKPKK